MSHPTFNPNISGMAPKAEIDRPAPESRSTSNPNTACLSMHILTHSAPTTPQTLSPKRSASLQQNSGILGKLEGTPLYKADSNDLSLPRDASLTDIKKYLHDWVTKDPENLKEAYDEVLRFLNSPTQENQGVSLRLTWNALPHIFHTQLMQDKLKRFTILCPKNETPEVGVNVLELPELAGNLTYLTFLSIEGEGVTKIAESIGTMTRLQSLFILGCSRVSELPESLCNLAQLEELKITGTGMMRLPEGFGHLRALKILVLDYNGELVSFPRSFVQLKSLEILSLFKCSKLVYLPEFRNPRDVLDESGDFSNLEALTKLNLFGCCALSSLPPSIIKLKNLTYLNISSCRELTALPELIGKLPLQNLYFLSTPKITSLPVSLYRRALSLELEETQRFGCALQHEEDSRRWRRRQSAFLPSPWNETVQWMHDALHKKFLPYEVKTHPTNGSQELHIKIHPETAAPFAQEHLHLLVECLENHSLTSPPPIFSRVRYEGQNGIDLGGLSRHFWHQFFFNIDHPILKRSSEGCLLEMETNRPINAQDVKLCKNIGKLLSAFVDGLSVNYTIGNVFPPHFYTGLLLGLYYKRNFFGEGPLKLFHEMPPHRQLALCKMLALHDKNGLKDSEGSLLYVLDYFADQSEFPTSDKDLYKVWNLINLNESPETIEKWFPSMREFIVSDESITEESDRPRLVQTFRKDLNLDKQFIASSVARYVMASYGRQCDPLTAVMQGFQVSQLSRDTAIRAFSAVRGQRLTEASQELSNSIQGPPFTCAAFAALIERSRLVTQNDDETTQILLRRVQLIANWYVRHATEVQMKDFVRCMHGADSIIGNMSFEFNGPEQVPVGPDQFVLSPHSVFHTCSNSVSLGNQLMSQEVITEEGKSALISTWLEHIHLAMPPGSNFHDGQ